MDHPQNFPPIEDHGVIGDLASVALVGLDARIDFLCFPAFDSPTVFAALLDPEKGGRFDIVPALQGVRHRQMYLPDTAVLMTRFLSADGVAEVIDLMPPCTGAQGRALVRWVRTVQGRIGYRMVCAPRFDYARAGHETRLEGGVVFAPESNALPSLRLIATVPLDVQGDDGVASFTLGEGEQARFVLFDAARDDPPEDAEAFGHAAFEATLEFWRGWSAKASYQGRWREMVSRSALTLKLMTSQKHGSAIAAPTFGLPEGIGGERNWDYRFTWMRDAAFTMYAFIRLGYVGEAERFTRWVEARLAECGEGQLKIMYSLDGSEAPAEQSLDEFAGYRESRPVRIGNAAREQTQLDIYGEMMDAAYLANKHGTPSSYDAWQGFARSVTWVSRNWDQPDAGIWEVRGEMQHFLHSRVLCWVAIDRGIRLAQKLSFPAPIVDWAQARTAIYHDVHTNFWDAGQGIFVQSKGSKALDASVLLMPLVRFISPTDPRFLSTLDAVGARLSSDPLVKRYTQGEGAADGLQSGEGAFTTCSFWYAECLARAGRVDEGRLVFEKMLGYANHLGLFSEELGASGEHLGNFPQALTHLALISAAVYLDRKLSGRVQAPWSA